MALSMTMLLTANNRVLPSFNLLCDLLFLFVRATDGETSILLPTPQWVLCAESVILCRERLALRCCAGREARGGIIPYTVWDIRLPYLQLRYRTPTGLSYCTFCQGFCNAQYSTRLVQYETTSSR